MSRIDQNLPTDHRLNHARSTTPQSDTTEVKTVLLPCMHLKSLMLKIPLSVVNHVNLYVYQQLPLLCGWVQTPGAAILQLADPRALTKQTAPSSLKFFPATLDDDERCQQSDIREKQ